MLLLYPHSVCVCRTQIWCNLHSTMLLLYLHISTVIRIQLLHLHSTMLLLYLMLISCTPPPVWIYIPLCFYFISSWQGYAPAVKSFTFHYASTLSPSPFSPSIFFNTNILFVYPTFFIALFSKIFLLPLYKIWIFLDISSFVYLPAIFLYLRSTITRNYLSYHHPLPRTP